MKAIYHNKKFTHVFTANVTSAIRSRRHVTCGYPRYKKRFSPDCKSIRLTLARESAHLPPHHSLINDYPKDYQLLKENVRNFQKNCLLTSYTIIIGERTLCCHKACFPRKT